MENKQTSIEWLESKLLSQYMLDGFAWEDREYFIKLLSQAKAMEKEQIKDAWKDSNHHRYVEEVLEYSAEEYYNETYGK